MGILIFGALYCVYKISVADFQRRIIPDVYLFPLILIGFIITSCFSWLISPAEAAISGAFAYGLGAITGFVFEKAKKTKTDYPPIGMGDVKLLAAGGIWLGTTSLAIAIIIATIIGGIWGYKKKQKFIPFAPFFFIGAIIALIIMLFLI